LPKTTGLSASTKQALPQDEEKARFFKEFTRAICGLLG
jgi:hypothetical protein